MYSIQRGPLGSSVKQWGQIRTAGRQHGTNGFQQTASTYTRNLAKAHPTNFQRPSLQTTGAAVWQKRNKERFPAPSKLKPNPGTAAVPWQAPSNYGRKRFLSTPTRGKTNNGTGVAAARPTKKAGRTGAFNRGGPVYIRTSPNKTTKRKLFFCLVQEKMGRPRK